MVRNPDRIPEVLDAVEKRWRESPDLRLGQLMWVIADGDPHGLEDDHLMQRLDRDLSCEYFIEPNAWDDLYEKLRGDRD